MESMQPPDVEKFLIGLGSVLPPEVIKALLDEVRRGRLDGSLFDQLLRSTQPCGGNVRSAHIATVRRCWASRKNSGASTRTGGTNRTGSTYAPSEGQSIATTETGKRSTSTAQHSKMSRPRSSVTAGEGSHHRHGGSPRGGGGSRASVERVGGKQLERRSRSAVPTESGSFAGPQRPTTANPSAGSKDRGSSKDAMFQPPPRRPASAKVLGSRHEEERKNSQQQLFQMQQQMSQQKQQQQLLLQQQSQEMEQRSRKQALQQAHQQVCQSSPAPSQPDRSSSQRRRHDPEDEPLFQAAVVHKKFVRHPLVPPLDFSLLYKKREEERRKEEEQRAIQVQKRAAFEAAEDARKGKKDYEGNAKDRKSHSRSNERAKIPPGYASASAEEQQRIAAFYGYRDDGFKATMHGLRTDEIRPRLYLGTMADAAYWPLLKALGVSHVLNCAMEAQRSRGPYEAHGVKYMLMNLSDTADEASNLCKQQFKTLREATRFIDSSLQARDKNAVFVHCVQGLSRSAAIVCAYLMEYEHISMDRALTEMRSRHKGCLSSHHWQALLYKFSTEL